MIDGGVVSMIDGGVVRMTGGGVVRMICRGLQEHLDGSQEEGGVELRGGEGVT